MNVVVVALLIAPVLVLIYHVPIVLAIYLLSGRGEDIFDTAVPFSLTLAIIPTGFTIQYLASINFIS